MRPTASPRYQMVHLQIDCVARLFPVGLILLTTLIIAVLERRGLIPWVGYPSSLVLLVMSWWHKRRFGVVVRFFPLRSNRRTLPLVISIVLVTILMLVACTPIRSRQGPSPVEALHMLILVPLSEELYFRGLLFEHLRRGFTAIRATLLCSLLFAILHYPFTATLSAGCLSLIACALVLKTGSLACTLQLHIAWNTLSAIHGIGHLSSRWILAIFASAVIVIFSIDWSKKLGSRSNDDSH